MNALFAAAFFVLYFSWPKERGSAQDDFLVENTPSASASDTALLFDVEHYTLTLNLDIPAETLSATTDISLKMLEAADSVELDFVGMDVSDVKEGAAARSFTRRDSSLVIALGRTAAKGSTIDLSIAYHGEPTLASSGFGKGLYIDSRSTGDAVTYTCNAPWGAKYWFPCQDNPLDKATMEMVVTVPSDYEVIANGVLVSVTASGSAKSYRWQEMHPIATYLIALAVSKNYAVTVDTAVIGTSPLPLYHWVLKEDSAIITPKLTGVKEAVEYFSALFYPYPFVDEKYAQVYAPLSGAMENQTCTHINTDIGWEDWGVITAHELSHSWWGNSTGFGLLKHVWLSEGLATYSAALWVEHRDGPQAYENYFETDIAGKYLANPSVFYYTVLDPPWSLIYSELTYEKPAAVLHMLRRLIGDEKFFNILRTYGERFKDSTALSQDFEEVTNQVSGDDYSWFFDEWLRSPAHPQYMITWSGEDAGDSSLITIRVRQTQSWPADVGVFKMPLEFGILEDNDTSFVWFEDSLRDQTFSLLLGQAPSQVLFDPHKNLLKKTLSAVKEDVSDKIPCFECPSITTSSLPYYSNSTSPVDISLYDVSGRRLSFLENLPSRGTIDLSGFPCGVYYLKVESIPSLQRVVLVK